MTALLTDTSELELFKTPAIQNFIEFKWREVGWNTHIVGFLMHIVYIGGLVMYTQLIYIKNVMNYENEDYEQSSGAAQFACA